jgi:hypothetical protein
MDHAPRGLGRMRETMAAKSWICLAGAALLLVTATPAPGSAQQADTPGRTAKSDQAPRPAPKTVKPAPRASGSQASRAAGTQNRQWTLEDALPDHSAVLRQYEPPVSPKIGRVPLQSGSGSVGFETENKVNPLQTPDGATLRGLSGDAARSQSYLGLSLSVPTNDKAMAIPVLPPPAPLW